MLSDKVILQRFLVEFHKRQGKRLRDVPKIPLDHNWVSSRQLFVGFISRRDWTNCIDQYGDKVIIPFTDVIIDRVCAKMGDCDVLVFHKLPLPKYINGCVESLDGVSARLVTAVDYNMPSGIASRIDIAFTPMWLKRTTEKHLYYVGKE